MARTLARLTTQCPPYDAIGIVLIMGEELAFLPEVERRAIEALLITVHSLDHWDGETDSGRAYAICTGYLGLLQ